MRWGVVRAEMLATTRSRKPKEDVLLGIVLGHHRTPKIPWVVLVLMPQETHGGAGEGNSDGQEDEDRWTLRTFRREKLGD